MAHIQSTISNALLESVSGKNTLVNDLARRRMYDTAVDEFNARDRRPKVNFSKTISEEQTLLVSNAYPEFQITFYNTQNAVHSLAGGLRALELEYLMLQVPYGSPTYDIGGNFAAHLFKGRDYVHCCMPNLDIRDIMRHEGQKDSIEMYLSRLSRSNKVIPEFQREAFNRYAEAPNEVCCSKTFQDCRIHPPENSGRRYAVALHSLYDIPVHEFGAALISKNIHVCYAAFHFAEALLLDQTEVTLNEIGATFKREGDDVSFFFADESTLNYSHKYKNILHYVVKSYFPASSRIVYFKEFLVTRVNTWFCKFTKVDTYILYKSVRQVGCDSDQFYEAMEDAFAYKKTLAMFNTERAIFRDTASVNFWFPKMKDMVIVPLFEGSITSKKMTRSEVIVNRDFVYTVLNHIRTYQAKALTYQNVLSFVESIRSRVIINGVTARSEWDVDKAILQPLSMTFFLQTKLAALQDDIVMGKFRCLDKTTSELIWDEVGKFFGNVFPTIKERLVSRKILDVSENALKIKIPDLYVTWKDRFVAEYTKSEELPHLDIKKDLEEAEQMYDALSELSILKGADNFDIAKFKDMCKALDVSPDVAARVIVAVAENRSGLTLTFDKPTEENVAKALKSTASEAVVCLEPTSEEVNVNKFSIAEKGKLPVCAESHGLTNANLEHQELESLNDFHKACVDSVITKQMASVVYTGSLKVQQMKNYVDSLAASLSATVSNLCKSLKDVVGYDSDSREKVGVWDVTLKKWLLKPTAKGHSWGVVLDYRGKMFTALLSYEGDRMVTESDWRRVAVSSDTMVYSDIAKLQNLRKTMRDGEPHEPTAKMVLVDGVPGCGKTKEILERVDLDEDLILVPGKQAAAMIRRRANSSGLIRATMDNVRTVDSFLMHPKPRSHKRLFIDEGLMLHTGCVNFLVLISGCDIAYIYGDTQQIPFINRVQNFPYPKHFEKLQVDEVEMRRTTLRCPGDVNFFLQSKYEGAVSTTSTVQRSVSSEMIGGKGVLNSVSKPLKGKIVTFTQADKFELEEKGYKNVNTVHEIQGETFEDVSLVRLTATPLTLISKSSPHVLVALTRHTKSFKYYTVVLDPLVQIISDLSSLSSFLLEMYMVEAGSR
nr:p126 KDa protein [Tobacco mild green mosaic virus]